MKYSRMEKYHGNKKENKTEEDIKKEEEKIDKHPNMFMICLMIFVVGIFFCYLIFMITQPSERTKSTAIEEKSSVVVSDHTKSESESSTYDESSYPESNNVANDIEQEYANAESKSIEENQNNQDNQESSSQTQNDSEDSFQQANNHMFDSITAAQTYGHECVNKGICTKYQVVLTKEGQYQVILR